VIVIVGHGPGIVGKRLGSWLDTQRVVRLKKAEKPDAVDWGSRTDVVCATSHLYRPENGMFWWFPKAGNYKDEANMRVADVAMWRKFYADCGGTKGPSSGLCAIFCAVEFERPDAIGLAGFDNLLYPDQKGWGKWWQPRHKYYYDADGEADHKAAMALDVKLVDVTKEIHG
jgi:hypothetical protein